MFSCSCPSRIAARSTTSMEAGTSKLDSATRVAVTTIGERSPDELAWACAKPHHPGIAAMSTATCLFIRLPSAAASHRFQRLLQIRDEVIGMLDADGDPDQPLADTDALARLFRHAGMRGARRVRDERLCTAEAHRELHHLHPVEQAECLGFASLHLEAEGRSRAL